MTAMTVRLRGTSGMEAATGMAGAHSVDDRRKRRRMARNSASPSASHPADDSISRVKVLRARPKRPRC